jgi:glutamate racemase
MWVPLVENNEIETEGAEFFVRRNIQNILEKDKNLDTLILGCTHYPLLSKIIRKYVPKEIEILKQGHIVAEKLVAYLARHPEMEQRLSKSGALEFQTTESAETFESRAALFMEREIKAKTIHL